jgi:hypothetical protein
VGWAEDLANDKALVLHLVAGRIGRVLRLWAPGVFISPENNEAVTAPVLQLDSGDYFLADALAEHSFHRMTPAEEGLVEAFTSILKGVTMVTAQGAAARGVQPENAAVLLRSCLEQAARALKVDV